MMRREDCKLNMPVSFGRSGANAEQTAGVVVKMNLKTAKVRITEDRGAHSKVGTIWGVPYALMTPLNPQDQAAVKANAAAIPERKPQKLVYNPFDGDNDILQCVFNAYMGLEPESLSCDGEASMAHIRSRRAELTRKLKGLQYALGYEVSAEQAFDWHLSKEASKQQQRTANANAERTSEICGLPQGINK